MWCGVVWCGVMCPTVPYCAVLCDLQESKHAAAPQGGDGCRVNHVARCSVYCTILCCALLHCAALCCAVCVAGPWLTPPIPNPNVTKRIFALLSPPKKVAGLEAEVRALQAQAAQAEAMRNGVMAQVSRGDAQRHDGAGEQRRCATA